MKLRSGKIVILLVVFQTTLVLLGGWSILASSTLQESQSVPRTAQFGGKYD